MKSAACGRVHRSEFSKPFMKIKSTQLIMKTSILMVVLATMAVFCACAQETPNGPGQANSRYGSNSKQVPSSLIREKISLNSADMKQEQEQKKSGTSAGENQKPLETITLGAGCFWCVEAVYQRIKGVEKWTSGYMGGRTKNPTYKEVCTGFTGHAEVVQLEFDPTVITLDQILDIFWIAHDPTTLNRQGADVGTQYRSVIFYHTAEQKDKAMASRIKANTSGIYRKPIVTEISPASTFYPAEGYHQNYFNQNSNAGYCQVVIWPKLKKLGLPFKKD